MPHTPGLKPANQLNAAIYRVSLVTDAPDQPGLYPWPQHIQLLDRTYTLETRGVASPRHASATYVSRSDVGMMNHSITLYPN